MQLRVPDSMKNLVALDGPRDPQQAFVTFNTPKRIAVARREAEVLSVAQRFELPFEERDFPGPSLPGWAWGGDGPLVVLAHGWSARAATMTAFVEPLLDRGCRVMAFDFPAHGDAPGEVCNGYMVSRAWRRFEAQHGPIHGAITHSFGSIGINLFMLDGGRLNRVVHVAAFNSVVQRFLEFCLAMGFNHDETSAFMEEADRYFGKGKLESIQADKICRDFAASSLIIHDEGDGEILVSASQEMAAAWPGSQLTITQGLGHFRIIRDKSTVESAARFAAALA